MPKINCKVELKLKWTKYCALSAAGADNTNANPSNIIFTIKDTRLFFSVVTFTAKDYQKLSKLLSKGFQRSVYCNECKKVTIKIQQMNINIFSNHILLELIDYLFILVYSNENDNPKRFKALILLTKRNYW